MAAFQVVLHLVARDYTAGTASLIQSVMWLGALGEGVGVVQGFSKLK